MSETRVPDERPFEIVGPGAGQPLVEAWTDVYVAFEPKSPAALDLRRELRARLRRLASPLGEVLHATLAGSLPPRADVENLLLYNVDMGGGSFAGAARSGLRFELATRPAGAAPSGKRRAYSYRYRPVPVEAGFEQWQQARRLATWRDVELGVVAPTLTAVWLALRRAIAAGDAVVAEEPLAPGLPFAVRVVVYRPAGASPSAPALVKPVLDGVVCALQTHGDHSILPEVSARIATQSAVLGASASEIARLLRTPAAPNLGVVPRLVFPRASGVQWAPGDDRCLAGELLVSSASSSEWRIDVDVVEIAPE